MDPVEIELRHQLRTVEAEVERLRAALADAEREKDETMEALRLAGNVQHGFRRRAEAAESALSAERARAEAAERERDRAREQALHFAGDIDELEADLSAALAARTRVEEALRACRDRVLIHSSDYARDVVEIVARALAPADSTGGT